MPASSVTTITFSASLYVVRLMFTQGGLSQSEEICEATLVYYPKARLSDCRSQPELYQYLGAIGVMNATGETFRKINVSYSPET